MATKYQEGSVTYGASGRRWKFEAPGYGYASSNFHGGVEVAHKVARIINGGVKRSKGAGIDNLARSNMMTVMHAASPAGQRAHYMAKVAARAVAH